MHYRNGRPAQDGDFVVAMDPESGAYIAGVLTILETRPCILAPRGLLCRSVIIEQSFRADDAFEALALMLSTPEDLSKRLAEFRRPHHKGE